MPITVIVRSDAGTETRLTFDGMQRVVIGRGASCDVRLPDPSVSHRHAYVLAEGAEFRLFDEGSTNGTFVGRVRVAPRTSRIVRSGDMVHLGRVSLEFRIEQAPITRDVAAATRDLALALVAERLAARGDDLTTRVRVVEGADQGAALGLVEEGRAYVIGRGPQCDLLLSDPDVSREHGRVTRNGTLVQLRDLAGKNGTWVGDSRATQGVEIPWRASQAVRMGSSVLALEEPIQGALLELERAPDERVAEALSRTPEALPAIGPGHASPTAAEGVDVLGPATAPPIAAIGPEGGKGTPRRGGYSVADVVVMSAALGMLVLSIAGLIWLLR